MVSGLPHIDADGDFAGYRGTGTLITERKRIEEETQRQNNTLSTLFENFPGGISMFNADLLLTEHNHQFKQLLNFPDSLFKKPGVCFEDIIRYNAGRGEYGPGDIEQQVAAIVARAREFQPHKTERVRPDGTVLEIRGVPMPKGGFISIYTDITERRTAEMALVTETARLYALLETASDGIHILDMNGNLTQCSHSFATMLGYTDAEISGFNVTDWDAQIPQEYLIDVVREQIKTPAKFETRHRCKDGSIIDVEIHSKGVVIGGEQFLYASSRDITERKRHEYIAAELNHQVVQLNQRFSLAKDAAHIGVWDYAVPEGQLLWDKWMYALYGIQEEDFSGAYEAWQNVLHPDDKVRGDDEINQALRGEKEFDTEFRVVWPTGEVRHIKASALVLRDAEGKPLRMIGVNYDITGRKCKEEELERAMNLAEAANIAKSRFLATMSHEIRTPMNGVIGMAQMLLTPNLKEDEREDYARIILTSGKTLLALLNDILDISKVEAGKIELESIALDPEQIIHEIRTLFAESAGQKGLSIECGWAELIGQPGQRYLGDPHRLRQMLSNLVGNALKFTAHGHIRIEAREVGRDGSHALLEFSVTDTGIGIPPDKQALLFKPFSQADSSITRQYGGSGLGLSLVRSMAQLMGGEVGIESEVGQGSRFWFRIRVDLLAPGVDSRNEVRQAIVGVSEENPSETGGAPTGVYAGTFTGHILAVDDNPTNRLVLKAMLKKSGVRCDFVEDGQQAVDAITGGMNPDLVLMDCQMPVMDGFEATLQIRRWEIEQAEHAENARPRLPIVALTAGAFEEDRQRCLEVGMDDFLAKPLDIEKLTATLVRWLGVVAEVSEVSEAGVVAEAGAVAEAAEASPEPPAASTPQEAGPPVFDENTLLTQLGGDRDLARIVIGSATEDIPNYFAQLEQAIAAGDWKLAKRQTHTMKGLTAQIGGIRLSARMKALDDHLNGGGDTDSATLIDLRREYQWLSDALACWMASSATTTPAPNIP
jgi:PAS domain S-box-containing protein